MRKKKRKPMILVFFYKEGLTSGFLKKYIKRIEEEPDKEILSSLEEIEDVKGFSHRLYDLLTDFILDMGMEGIPSDELTYYDIGFYQNDAGEVMNINSVNDKLFVHLTKHLHYLPENKRTARKQEREDQEVVEILSRNTRIIALYEIPNMQRGFLNLLIDTDFTFLNRYIPSRITMSLPNSNYDYGQGGYYTGNFDTYVLSVFLEFASIKD